eukprot:1056386-Pyramimonas_sp.AAC.1
MMQTTAPQATSPAYSRMRALALLFSRRSFSHVKGSIKGRVAAHNPRRGGGGEGGVPLEEFSSGERSK